MGKQPAVCTLNTTPHTEGKWGWMGRKRKDFGKILMITVLFPKIPMS
jgi:hypothetical protein